VSGCAVYLQRHRNRTKLTCTTTVFPPPPEQHEGNDELGAQIQLLAPRDCQIPHLHRLSAGGADAEGEDLRGARQRSSGEAGCWEGEADSDGLMVKKERVRLLQHELYQNKNQRQGMWNPIYRFLYDYDGFKGF